MIVTCQQCGRVYDDAQRWTICPHRGLDTSPRPHPIDELRIDEIEGWMERDELLWLYNQGRRAPVAVEIGAFMGRSTCAIAAGQLGLESAVLRVIDTFDGRGTSRAEEIAAHEAGDPGWLLKQFLENLKARFHVEHPNHDIKVVVAASDEPDALEEVHDGSVDFLFIDGSHDYESVCRDLALWVPRVRPGGLAAGHDYHESWPGVVQAVDEYARGRGWEVKNPVVGIWSMSVPE